MKRNVVLTTCVVLLLAACALGSCTSPANPIEAENCKPGSTGWGVSGSGDSTIQGFATDISFNVGQTVNFKISTTATSYRLDIYRLGYYQSNGARLITSIMPSVTLPQTQPACRTDPTTNLYDCGNWAVSASWTIPTSAVSGVYIADIIRSDTGGASQIVFVVRNDSSTSAVVFQTSDESWEAYNGYGGHSLYGATGFDLTNRAYKVSYNRPSNFIEGEAGVMYAEYPMIRWLEANGYDVSYISSVDTARNGALLTNHKIFLSVGHDEYWSGPKRANVEAARNAGVNLAFFSGNEVFWKTRWENSIDGSNTPYRTLVCYKETLGPTSNPPATTAVDPLDPPTWTGTWRDPTKSPPADGGRPENALTGQLFRVNGPGSDNTNLSIKVPAAMGKLRFWRNTPNVATQANGSTWTLPPASLGYEWDAEQDNGFRPAGLFDLSSATYTLTTDYLQDYGGLYGAGTATHKMSLYRASSGTLVFGAGTVQWSWGLDNFSGGTEDANMQQATVNLFADMGVQPATLQPGLLPATQSSDTIPPSSTVTAPASGTSVQAGAVISVAGTAIDSGGGLVAGVEVSVDNGATWHPATGTTSWSYTWTTTIGGTFSVMSRAVDDSGNLETPSAGPSVNVIGVASLTLNPSTVSGGNSSQGTVTLSAPASGSGVTVTLANSNSSTATIPASVLVAAGNTSATFAITTKVVGVSTPVSITATYASSVTSTLTVNPVFPPAPGVVDIDATASAHQSTSSTTITSPAFSTGAPNELVLALVSSDALQPNITVTGITGAGLTWNLVLRTNTQGGTAEIWRAFASTTLSNVSATATFSQSSPGAAITIMSFAGVDTSGTNGSGAIGNTASANSSKAAPSASLTTTRNNSWVLGVADDYDNAIARTLGSNQTLIDQYFTTTGDTLWSQRQNAFTPTSGTTVTINDTAPTSDSFNLSIVEVRPPVVGTLSISGSVSANGAGATVALTGAMTQTVTADSSGNYSFTALVSGSYTITPTKAGYVFSPASQAVTLTSSNVSNLNFTAAPTYSISGSISPSTSGSGATVTLSGAASATTTADSSGNFTFAGLVNGSYTITPSKLGFGFTPSSQSVTVNGANLTAINFTAAAQNFSISGNLSTSGANATVALSGAATASTTADSSGNYTFTGLGNGTYTVTPTKTGYTFNPASQTTSISGANVTGLNFTSQVVVTTSLATDVKVSTNGPSASSTISSPAFSTTAGNELLLAYISTDYLGGTNTTVTGVTGGGLTWVLVVRTNVQKGSSEIWRAFAPAPLSNATVTATLSQSVVSSITVVSYTGVDSTGTNGSGAIGATGSANATSGAPTASLVTTRNNSWVFGVGNDYDNAIARTPASGQSLVHQDLTSAGDTYWVQMQNSTTPLSGTTVSISDTAPTSDRYNLSIVEVLPALGPYSISGNVSPAVTGTTVALTGTVNANTTLDASGNFTFSGLPNGSYTVTPTSNGTTFSPASQSVTINGSSVTGVNFAVIAPVLTLSQYGVLFNANQASSNPAPATINVTNSGGSTLNFTAASDSAWLTVSPASGTAPQALQLSASISGLGLGTYVGHVTVTSAGSGNSPSTIAVTLKVNMPTDWLMVEHDEGRSGTAVDETTLTTANVANLQLLWQTTVDASVVAQPLYVHSISIAGQTRDIVVVGTGGNTLYVLDASNGSLIWKRNFGAPTPNTWGLPDGFGIEAPPFIDRVAGRIYTVSTDGNFHVLNLADGTDVYTPLTLIANPATNKVWGGLNRVGNSIYVATGSNGGDVAPWRGQVYQIDISAAPTLVGDFVVVPSIPAPNGGGGIWGYGGVSADLASGNVYAASADDSNVSTGGTEGYTPYSDSIIALNSNVALQGYYQAQQPATYQCSGAPCDLDFASTPLVFQPAGCSPMLAVGNKNGNLYLFLAADLVASRQPLQILSLNVASDSLGNGGVGGTPVYSPATNMLYITDTGPGVTGVNAGVVAMNVTASCTLQVAWSNTLGGSDSPNSTPTLANGMLFVGQGNSGVIHAYNASTGAELWHSGANYSAAATFAAPIVAGGRVYTGSWTSFSGGGVVGAFALPATSSYSISGNVSTTGAGATVALSVNGATTATTTADSSGNYTFSGLANGTYTVTPSKSGVTFSPASQTAAINNANVASVNFTATAQTWSISGNLSATGAGATVALSGAATASATADSSGNYTFTGLANGTYTVTPSKAGVVFTPTSQNVTISNANASAINFTAQTLASVQAVQKNTSGSETTVSSISAAFPAANTAGNTLIVVGTAARPSSTITISDTAGNTYTPAFGPITDSTQSVTAYIWYVSNCKGGSNTITLTPSTPGAMEIHISEWTGLAASPVDQTNSATGTGTTISSGSVTTSTNGELIYGYTFPQGNASAGSGFTPLTLVNGDLDEYLVQSSSGPVAATFTQDASVAWFAIVATFRPAAASSSQWSISGNVSATGAGATVALGVNGATTATTTADSSGNYTFSGLANGTYTVTPSKAGVTFSPASQTVTVNNGNLTSVNFTATAQTWTISGNVSTTGAGATVTLSGAATASTTADSSGNYTFSGLVNGSYTVTPSKSGISFTPASQAVTVNGANVTGVNFTAAAQTWTISGNLSTTGAGATVALSGAATASATADSSGNYTFSGLVNGAYTVTPTKSGYTFTPASQNVTVNGANVTGINFTASASSTGLALDVNVSTDTTTGRTSVASPALSTHAGNELLLAFVAADYLSGANTTVTGVSGGGLTWTLVKRTNVQSGDSEIWAAFASTALSNATVTATLSQSVVASITVLSFTGVDTTMGATLPNAVGATGTGNSSRGAPTASLVTTRNNSWVFGVGNDYDNAISRTPGAGQTIVHQFLTPTGDTYWVQMQSATTALSGTTVTINDTAPSTDRYNLTIVEVRTP